ncbi:MAG: xanthine dehydrogenase family protein molybdopterin-binding subunit [Chromatiales bacterium]|jgi:nicotinate dehydrogenase subunit B|nr:xanthine dehydrogenase family protein molybdopterin-binding subunit [Chromatiales bacterium]
MIDLKPSESLEHNPNCSDWFDFSHTGKVLLRTGKVEIGQGILTALVQIAADELDIHPDRFEVLSGHTRLGPLEAQTASSLSLEVTGRAIRLAASATYHRLAEQAATLLQANLADLSFVDGTVHIEGRDTPLTSWSLAQAMDLAVPVMTHAAPKPMAARKVVGTSLPRQDLRAKAVEAAFIHDIAPNGMRHGRVLQPPSVASRIATFDEAAVVRRFPDVHLVRDGSFIGVITAREEVAMRAITAVAQATTWDAGATVPADAVKALGDNELPDEVMVDQGDPNVGAGETVSIETRRAFFAHASIAPSCAIATWRDGDLEVISHTQSPHGLRDALGIVFDIEPVEHITVIHKPGAGTYGHSGQDDVALDAALLAKKIPGTPVRVIWSRADDFVAAPFGAGMLVRASMTLGADNKRIAAYSIQSNSQPHSRRPGKDGAVGMTAAERLAQPFATYCCDDVPLSRGGGAERNATPLYDFPHVRVAKRIVKDLPIRTSALRGLGAPANVFSLEALMDDAAACAGVDPVEFRLNHLSDDRAKAVIGRAAAMANWPGDPNDEGALGIGFAQYKNRSAYTAVVVRVSLDEDIHVTHAWAATDAGEIVNPDGLHNQVEGGIIQATSWTLKEAIHFDGDRALTGGWGDYPILKFSEVPLIEVELLDQPHLQPLGAGETSCAPTVAAIGNAVSRALGMRVTTIPITREAILAASNL